MRPRELLQLARRPAFALIDALPPARSLFARAIRRRFERRGPLNAIADEAVDGAATREAKRTAEMLMWSAAVAGLSPFPNWFPAGHHLNRPEGRRLSAEALAEHLSKHPDASGHLWRQFIVLSEPSDLTEAGSFVERDLRARLDRSATAGAPGRTPIPSERQLQLLSRAIDALVALGTQPFLVSGTLLGVIRDGRLLDHDYDIDLGLLPGAAAADDVGDALSRQGFDVQVSELKVVGRDDDGFAVDVFLHYERDGLLWHGTEIHEWWNTPFGLEASDVLGPTVWLPDDPITYLDENYGTWQRPIAFYNFSFDTPNRQYRSNHHALLYLHRRAVAALELGDRWTVESAVRELRDVFGVDVTDSLQPTALLGDQPSSPSTAP